MKLEQDIKNSATSSTFGDVSQMELAPIAYDYPKILEYVQRNGKIHEVITKEDMQCAKDLNNQ